MNRTLTLAPCLIAAGAFAGTTLVYDVKGQQKAQTVTIGVEGKKLYVESSGAEGPSSTLVRDGEAKRTTIAMHAKKEVMEMSDEDAAKMKEKMTALREQMKTRMKAQMDKMSPEQRAQMEKMMGDPGASVPTLANATYEKKGGSQTIAGYACEMYLVKHDGKADAEACFTPLAKLGGALDELRVQMKDMMKGFAFSAQNTGNDFDWADSAPGFPVLHRRLDDKGQMVSESKLKSLTRGTIAASKFVAPADYKLSVPPGMGGVAGPGAMPRGTNAPSGMP